VPCGIDASIERDVDSDRAHGGERRVAGGERLPTEGGTEASAAAGIAAHRNLGFGGGAAHRVKRLGRVDRAALGDVVEGGQLRANTINVDEEGGIAAGRVGRRGRTDRHRPGGGSV